MHMFIYIWDVCESTDFIRCCVYIVIPALNYINHPLISFKRCWSLSQLSLGERCGIPWHSTNSEAVMVLGFFFWQCFKAVDLLSMCYSWAFVLIVLHDFHGFSLFIFFLFQLSCLLSPCYKLFVFIFVYFLFYFGHSLSVVYFFKLTSLASLSWFSLGVFCSC